MKTVLYFFLTLWLLTACRKPIPSSTSTFLPLAVGNQWMYKVTLYDSIGPVPTFRVDTFLLECAGTTVLNNKTYYTLKAPNASISTYLTNENLRWQDGYCYVSNQNTQVMPKEEVPYLKEEVQLGDSWSWSQPYVVASYQVQAVDTTIVVLGTSFDEVALVQHVRASGLGGSASFTYSYYKKRVGLVKQLNSSSGKSSTMELLSYVVK